MKMEKTKWVVDPVHSEITFKVKHMMMTNVTGVLSDYTIEATSDDEKFHNAEISFSGKTTSISTGNAERDNHLRSEAFFDVEKNPEIRFKSTGYEQVLEKYKLSGNLTIKNVTREITLDVDYKGVSNDPWGKLRAGFTVTGEIDRTTFGLTWNTPLDGGGLLVSSGVKIFCEIQMVKKEMEPELSMEAASDSEKNII
jgi:polyisoprenoid-binding protein YceI